MRTPADGEVPFVFPARRPAESELEHMSALLFALLGPVLAGAVGVGESLRCNTCEFTAFAAGKLPSPAPSVHRPRFCRQFCGTSWNEDPHPLRFRPLDGSQLLCTMKMYTVLVKLVQYMLLVSIPMT